MSAKTNGNAAVMPEKKTVTVRLERKKGQPSEEVIVGGSKWTVPRGREVEVPIAVAEVLNRREEYAIKAMDYEESNLDRDN